MEQFSSERSKLVKDTLVVARGEANVYEVYRYRHDSMCKISWLLGEGEAFNEPPCCFCFFCMNSIF